MPFFKKVIEFLKSFFDMLHFFSFDVALKKIVTVEMFIFDSNMNEYRIIIKEYK